MIQFEPNLNFVPEVTPRRASMTDDMPRKNGAPGRVRTRDPLITNQVLYQLSYKGICMCQLPYPARL